MSERRVGRRPGAQSQSGKDLVRLLIGHQLAQSEAVTGRGQRGSQPAGVSCRRVAGIGGNRGGSSPGFSPSASHPRPGQETPGSAVSLHLEPNQVKKSPLYPHLPSH